MQIIIFLMVFKDKPDKFIEPYVNILPNEFSEYPQFFGESEHKII